MGVLERLSAGCTVIVSTEKVWIWVTTNGGGSVGWAFTRAVSVFRGNGSAVLG